MDAADLFRRHVDPAEHTMINASLNWASIAGLLLLALWIPALVVSLRRFDALMRRDQSSNSVQGLGFGLFLINVAGRTIALPLVAGILFFQGWRLDPILQFGVGLMVLGMIFESIRTIGIDSRALDRDSPRDAQQSVRQLALERRLQDRIWPWSIAHFLLPFAGIYYAITRRTITPLLWDFIARFVVILASAGIILLIEVLLPVSREQMIWGTLTSADWVKVWVHVFVFLLMTLVNIVAGVLPVRAAIRRTQADARRRLAPGE
ncbi:MAG: hypothetical protein AB8A39_04375 [Prochlorococcus sp.]